MKKVLSILAVATLLIATSCTKEQNYELPIDSPDKDKQECTGCDNGNG